MNQTRYLAWHPRTRASVGAPLYIQQKNLAAALGGPKTSPYLPTGVTVLEPEPGMSTGEKLTVAALVGAGALLIGKGLHWF